MNLVERRPLRPPTSRENPAAESGRRSTGSSLKKRHLVILKMW